MAELGVSVYPDLSPLSEIRAYLKLASSYGASRVFSSMFSVEGTNEEIISYFREFIETAHQYQMKVSLDVNPVFLEKLGVTPEDISLFHEIGCDIIRLDMSYGKEKDLIICKNPYGIQIQLNASMGIEEELKYLKENGVTEKELLLGHNFYPQRYTGLKWKNFISTNEALKQYGYPIDAFMASHAENTHGVWDAKDGLPTVEKMRDMPCDLAYRILEASGTDHIFFGNAYASEEEFASLKEVMADERNTKNSPLYEPIKKMGITLPETIKEVILKVIPGPDITEAERYMLFDFWPQTDYGDSSEWIWRSRSGRFVNSEFAFPYRKYEGEEIPAGSVVIVNDNYRHYAGEIQIARLPLRNDGQRNVIGHLADNEADLLELLPDGTNIRFVKA